MMTLTLDTPPTTAEDRAEALGRELDALRARTLEGLGARDVAHIRGVIRAMRSFEAIGRGLLHFGVDPVTFVVGSASLGVAKILENMEIGHNVMHGQYDWTRDPKLDGKAYDWDTSCAAEHWRHSHNYEHHTFTNIVGKDRDVGYGLLRVTEEQPWHPAHLLQPIAALGLALGFEWGVALHDLRIDETVAGKQSFAELRARSRPFLRKAAQQLFKDYVFFPALSLWNAPRVALGNLLANGIRNLWTFAIIFCGHFPEGTRMVREEDAREETRGQWYVRQLEGSANLEGGRWFHVMSGHLSHQIEHHLFPDLPASRYPELAPEVRALADKYGYRYNTGGFFRQMGSVIAKIFRFALPNRAPRVAPSPAP
ncbi:MAG: acyl-CoA desaturase [Myxococcales bacterium]|nr:acyl-CoA desaturase [Myxococcales bacterium]